MFAEGGEGVSSQRRSKSEMVGDVLYEISRGAVRPTRIMQRANLTWNAMLMYLNALVTHGFVAKEEQGQTYSYRLTEKGRRTLDSYLALKGSLAPLNLDRLDSRAFSRTLRSRPPTGPAGPVREQVAESLRKQGYRILGKTSRGKSGVEHEFSVVAKDAAGVVHGYILTTKADEKTILALFVKQLDTGHRVHVMYTGEATTAAAERAREYGIELSRWSPASA